MWKKIHQTKSQVRCWVLNSGEQKNKINSVTHFLGSLFWYKQQLFVFKKRMIAMSDEICENSI